jgi:hypothetical protein
MRRTVALCVALCAMLAITAVAFAAQVNTYTVTGDTSPTTAGTTKKPVPIKLDFNYTVGEASGLRPALVNKYSIFFGGLSSNGGLFPKCTAAAINAAGSDISCPAGSAVGTGNIENEAGPSNDPTNKTTACHLNLTVYNSGQSKAALFLKGGPPTCPLNISQAIDAKYVKKTVKGIAGFALEFTVQGTLLNPIPGFDNSVVLVKSTIKKLTKTVKGKKVGYYESIGGCKKGKRPIQVTFTTVAGQSATATNTAKCK